jgi:hypothetical protein
VALTDDGVTTRVANHGLGSDSGADLQRSPASRTVVDDLGDIFMSHDDRPFGVEIRIVSAVLARQRHDLAARVKEVRVGGAQAAAMRAHQRLPFGWYRIRDAAHVDLVREQIGCLHFSTP